VADASATSWTLPTRHEVLAFGADRLLQVCGSLGAVDRHLDVLAVARCLRDSVAAIGETDCVVAQRINFDNRVAGRALLAQRRRLLVAPSERVAIRLQDLLEFSRINIDQMGKTGSSPLERRRIALRNGIRRRIDL
jgi:hypothetical protein